MSDTERAPDRQRLVFWCAVLAIVLGSLLLRSASLDAGRLADDYDHAAMLDGRYAVERAPWDLYNFHDGTPAETDAFVAASRLPWWTHPELKLSMLRPLASLLLWLDDAVVADDVTAMHVHSLFWWACFLLIAAAFYRPLLPWPAALLATLMLAVEPAATLPVSWLAHRHTLVAGTLALAAVVAHVHGRTRLPNDRARGAVVAVLAGLALLGGEYAIVILAAAVVRDLMQNGRSFTARVRAALPVLAPAVLFVATRYALGYGIAHSEIYAEPTADPAAYAQQVLVSVPRGLADALFAVPVDGRPFGTLWYALAGRLGFSPEQTLGVWPLGHLALGLLGAGCAAFWIYRGLRGGATAQERQRGWLAGAALAALVLFAGAPNYSSRLMLAPLVALNAVLAGFTVSALTALRRGWSARGVLAALGACGVLLLHVAHDGRESHEQAGAHARLAQIETAWMLAPELAESRPDETVVIVNVRDRASLLFIPYVLAEHGVTPPERLILLSGGRGEHVLTRTAPDVLELRLGGEIREAFNGSLLRDAAAPLRAGDRVSVPGLQVEVVAESDGQPTHLRYRFERSLDDARYRFVHPYNTGLRTWTLPPVGASVRILAPAQPNDSVLPRR